LADAQEKVLSEKQLIMSFLQTISAPNYKSTLGDFIKFFDGKSTEIEGGLRHEYAINKGIELSWDDINSRSLAIDQLLNETTFKRLLIIKKKKNYNWTIFSSYKLGVTSTIYVVGVEHTAGSFQIQFINWPDMYEYGICDILCPTGESIYFSLYKQNQNN
jgi:hypothetical protein